MADLSGANLEQTDLRGANLYRANLKNTCLDPDNKPNANIEKFKFRKDKRHVIGYRSRSAGHIDKYRNGRTYSADWFSTSDTECHPGLYIWPTLRKARCWAGPKAEIIKVSVKPEDIHKAGFKWRCRQFTVIGKA